MAAVVKPAPDLAQAFAHKTAAPILPLLPAAIKACPYVPLCEKAFLTLCNNLTSSSVCNSKTVSIVSKNAESSCMSNTCTFPK